MAIVITFTVGILALMFIYFKWIDVWYQSLTDEEKNEVLKEINKYDNNRFL